MALGWAAVGWAQSDAPPTVDALFALLSRSPGLFARFHEEKKITLLVAPLVSDGTLHFDRGRGLARHTLSPRRQSVLVTATTLSFWDGKSVETVPLASSAPLRALADTLRMILAADRAGLEGRFQLAYGVDPSGTWKLGLVPRTNELASLVSSIDVTGRGRLLQSLRVAEARGDVSTTTFTDVDPDRRYSDAEARAVFVVPPGVLP